MKTNKYLNIAASVLMLAACAKEELVPSEELIPVSESTTVTFVATDGTKTVLGGDLKTTSWDKKENVLLWEGENALTIESKNYSDDGGKMTLTATVDSPESTFYSVIGPEGDGNATRTSAAVLATQKPAQASFDPNAEILVAQPATCGEGNTVALIYNRPVAIGLMTLKGLEPGEVIKTVEITTDCILTGTVTFDYSKGVAVTYPTEGGYTITCDYTGGTFAASDGGEFPVYFIAVNAKIQTLNVVVTTGAHKYSRTITREKDNEIILNDNRVANMGILLEKGGKADPEGDKFVKVTSEPTDWSGEYLLVYEASDSKALCWTGVDAADCNVEADIAEGEIADKPDNAVTLTIVTMTDEKGNEGYSVQVNGGDNNGKYIYGTSGSNTINFGTTATLNTLLYDSGVLITSNTSVMRYNSASKNNRFRYFKSSSYSDQQPVQLYKKEAGGYGKYTLATPTNILYNADAKKITWNAVENAEKYTISLNGGEPVECSSNEYDASALAAEYYYATIVAYPSAGKESTYQASSAGTNDGWFKIGEPKMPALVANDITLNITSTTITASWENDVNAANGYIAEIWSRKTVETGKTDEEGNPETTTVDDELISKNENVTDGAITFAELTPGADYHIKITTKAVDITDERGTRAYANSTAANKYPKTSSVYTIAQIFDLESSTVACEVKKAVIYAKGESCYLVYDGTGYIMVNTSAGNYSVGDELTISGKTEKSNNQKRFDSTTTIVEKTGTATVSHPTENIYDGEFTYAQYVKIIGKTSMSGSVVSITDADGHSLKLIDNAGLEGNQYVSVTGYLTHKTTADYVNMIVVDKQINTITVTENDGHEWDSNSVTEKSFTISTDNNAGWTYGSDNTTDWTVTKAEKNTLKVSPNATNPSSTSSKSLTITLTHSGNTMLTTTIQCSQKPKTVVYEKYTDNLTEGYYLITYGNGAMKNSVSSSRLEYVTITPQSDKVTDPAVSIVWKIAKSGNYWTIYNESVQKYAASTGADNKAQLIDSGTDDKSLWTVTMSNGTFEFVNKGNESNSKNANLRRNGNFGFACYANGTGGALTLYKLEDQRTTQTLNFSSSAVTYDIYNYTGFTEPTLTGAKTTVTYSSSDESVAEVNAEGKLSVKKVSPAEGITITATAVESEVYKSATAKYTLKVVNTTPVLTLNVNSVNVAAAAATNAKISNAYSLQYATDNDVSVGKDGNITDASISGGTVTYSISANQETEAVTSHITLTLNNSISTINVIQAPAGKTNLDAPSAVTVGTKTPTSVSAAWSAPSNVADVTGYEWIISSGTTSSAAENSYVAKGSVTGSSTLTFTHNTTYATGTTYYVYVRSVGDAATTVPSGYVRSEGFTIVSKQKKTATLTITATVTANGNITDDKGNTWAVSSDGNYNGSTTYIQVGSNNAKVSYLKLSTSAYKDIEKVQVWGTSKASTNVTPKINIDGSNKGEGSAYTSQTASSGGTEFSKEFSPRAEVSNTLEIEISRASSAKGAIYFNKAIITYYE